MKITLQHAFTLLETIVVLAVVSALATALLVPAVRHLDRVADEKESRTLQQFADAFRERVSTAKYVPGAADWVDAIAMQTGLQTSGVLINGRGQTRIFLIDPDLRIGNSISPSLPYSQPVGGAGVANNIGPIAPISPRFLLVSSISQPLPAQLSSGVAASSGAYSFANLWNTREGTLPSGWSWGGLPEDLKLQRIDLSDLFIPVILSNRDASLLPYYAIESVGTNSVPVTPILRLYFIAGTELRLLDPNQAPEYTEVLFASASFMFELGSWQAEVYLGRGVSQPGPLDLQRAINLFMKAPANPLAKFETTQQDVYNSMISYMSNFVTWRNESYPNGPIKNNVSSAQTQLANKTDDMINSAGKFP